MDSYFSGREMTRPLTCGKNMADFTWEELRAMPVTLTEEERKSPFARYYDEPLAPLQDGMAEACKAPLHPSQCYMPREAVAIMFSEDPRYPVNGYGVLDNGVGYCTTRIHQDGITDEMIKNYRENFAHDMSCRNLFYKTWYPGFHLIHFDDGIVENFGWGLVRQTMDWELLNMEAHLGIRREDIPRVNPACLGLLCPCGPAVNLENPEDVQYTVMVQYIREVENGRTLWIHYWNGIRLYPDGRLDICPSVDRKTMESEMKHMMMHAMVESCNEIKHIKEFWQETNKT